MDAYQHLLNERNKLAAEVAAQAVEINALEQSTAVRIGKRLTRFAPLVHQALHVARFIRKWRNKVRRPVKIKSIGGSGDGRPTVMVVVPDAIATPRTRLAVALIIELKKSYRVVAVLLSEGDVDFKEAADIVVGPLTVSEDNYQKALRLAEGLAAAYRPRFAIVASGQAAHLGMTLSTAGVPVIALMHELPAALTIPSNNAQTLMDRADDIIFSCRAVEDLYRPFYKRMEYRRTHVMIPGQDAAPVQGRLRDRLSYILDDCFLVVGLGAIDYRHGVDVFVSTASVLRDQCPDLKFHFVWIGTAPDTVYATYIDEQIARANLKGLVTLLYLPDEAQVIYQDVDLVYATARLDYLPSAIVDYGLVATPAACFANVGGIAEILASDPEAGPLLLPHMNVAAAANLIGELANDRKLGKYLGRVVQLRASQLCSIGPYAQKLIALGEEAANARANYLEIAQLLAQPGNFDAELYLGNSIKNKTKAIEEYLTRTYYDGFRKRALAGFHPEYYASQMPDAKTKRLDPLTHYLKAGRPPGPWLHSIIRLDNRNTAVTNARVAIHGHFYYIDQIGSLLQSLAANRTKADLFLTTGSDAHRNVLLDATKNYQAGKVSVEIVPNKGRDIGPFLYLYRTQLHNAYDYIGHVHGKRSLHTAKWDPNLGERWRNFLFQHLIGPKTSAMDIVLQEFVGDSKLGLVFPEDPRVIGWDYDLEHAQRLIERMRLTITLPPHIDFPIGTMFWARAQALEPLMRLDISWDEYPAEPLPVDGTILHALERLLPSIARAAGYGYAATYFPGIGY